MNQDTPDEAANRSSQNVFEETEGEFDERRKRERLNVLTQETRFTLIQNILSHPKQLPSLKELDYYNPSKSRSTIRNHLDTLIEHGLVKEREINEDDRSRDLPWKFYGLTDSAFQLLSNVNLLESEEVLQEIYELVEMNDEIARYADAPRPSAESKISSLEREIREAKSNTLSIADQTAIVLSMYSNEIGPETDGFTISELKELLADETSFGLRTSLSHLEDIGFVEAVTPSGPNFYVISERLDEIINGRVEEVAADDLENLIAHMEDELYSVDVSDVQEGDVVAITDGAGTTIRSTLAAEFGVDPEEVESFLRDGDHVEKLNAAIDAIEDSDQLSSGDEYGRILFRLPANRYRLTAEAMELVQS